MDTPLRAVSLHCFIVRQDVTLGLLIQHVDIVVGQVDDPHPTAGRINDYRGG
ncbi:hypothetical protein [Klebsiella pneumoniae]|uniref:hypothetical protein n=1 Tax=Klebsiella pneumoniae TaxID=573 RepID=UPI0040463B29